MEQHFDGIPGRVHRAVLRLAAPLLHTEGRARRLLRPAYSTLLYVASGGRGLPGTINGEQYRLDPRYRWRLWPDYEADFAAFLRRRIKPADCCVNVGANIGLHVLQMARWAPAGHVVAFEPNPSSFSVLKRHVRMNGLQDRVTLVQAAAGRTAGRARLFDTSSGSGLSRLGAANPAIEVPAGSVDVEVVALDDWCARSGRDPDIVVIDVEGFEFEVLAGATELLARAKPLFIVEMHPHLWPGGEQERTDAGALLSGMRRRVEAVDGRADPWSAGLTALYSTTEEPNA